MNFETPDGKVALSRPDGRNATLSWPGRPERRVALHRRDTAEGQAGSVGADRGTQQQPVEPGLPGVGNDRSRDPEGLAMRRIETPTDVGVTGPIAEPA